MNWNATPKGRHGGKQIYSDAAIQALPHAGSG